jgi:hypothetical protein
MDGSHPPTTDQRQSLETLNHEEQVRLAELRAALLAASHSGTRARLRAQIAALRREFAQRRREALAASVSDSPPTRGPQP